MHDGSGHGVVAAKVGVELAGEFQHAALGERATLADDFKTGGGEHLVMDAGGVLKGRGGQQDAGGGHEKRDEDGNLKPGAPGRQRRRCEKVCRQAKGIWPRLPERAP